MTLVLCFRGPEKGSGKNVRVFQKLAFIVFREFKINDEGMFSIFGSNRGDDPIGSSSVISLFKRIPGLWVFWAHGWRWSCFQLSLFGEIVVPISIKSKNGLPLDGGIGTLKISSEVKEFSVFMRYLWQWFLIRQFSTRAQVEPFKSEPRGWSENWRETTVRQATTCVWAHLSTGP